MEDRDVMTKDEYIGFRTTDEIKSVLQKLAEDGYRTLSQQCEMIIKQWLRQHGYLKDPSTRKIISPP
jgi:hypothetical protein